MPEEDFGPNPFVSAPPPTKPDPSRDAAREEAARDLVKDPRQLLTDVHQETINFRADSVARALARVASLQLRTQEATEALNRKVTFIGFVIGGFGLLFGLVQAVASVLQLCKP